MTSNMNLVPFQWFRFIGNVPPFIPLLWSLSPLRSSNTTKWWFLKILIGWKMTFGIRFFGFFTSKNMPPYGTCHGCKFFLISQSPFQISLHYQSLHYQDRGAPHRGVALQLASWNSKPIFRFKMCIFRNFGPWPIYWARRAIRFWGVIFLRTAFL